MLNRNGVKKQTYGAPVQILLNPDFQFSVGVVVSNATAVEEGGRKVVKAGTPLAGNLDARNTAFTVATEAANVQGILLHDVDVTDGNGNGTLLIFGFVNPDKIDATTRAMLTTEIKAAIPQVKFIKG